MIAPIPSLTEEIGRFGEVRDGGCLLHWSQFVRANR